MQDRTDKNLSGAQFSGDDLRCINFTRSSLAAVCAPGALFCGSDMTDTNCEGAHLVSANLLRVVLTRANLQGANLRGASLIESGLELARMMGSDCFQLSAQAAQFDQTVLDGVRFRLADLSYCRIFNASAIVASFSRATLANAHIELLGAHDSNFEFAEFRNSILIKSNFKRASFVGAVFDGCRAFNCNFEECDFYWAELDGLSHLNCSFSGARFPEKMTVAHRPRGATPPFVEPVPLYRCAMTAEERKKAIEDAFAGLLLEMS